MRVKAESKMVKELENENLEGKREVLVWMEGMCCEVRMQRVRGGKVYSEKVFMKVSLKLLYLPIQD